MTGGENRRRASSLGPTEMYLLNQWAAALKAAFGEVAVLVGSVARAEPWRDVDVRMMLDTDRLNDLTSGEEAQLQALNVAFTLWGQHVTGLPIDFQFQDFDEANAEYDGERIPIGIGLKRSSGRRTH